MGMDEIETPRTRENGDGGKPEAGHRPTGEWSKSQEEAEGS
jgi:hypothetical protein